MITEYPINLNTITPNSEIEFAEEVVLLANESIDFILDHKWCDEVKNGWLFTNFGKVACIFLFDIQNNSSPEDSLIWVVSGDFPHMYLDTFNVNSTKEVIETYINLGREWVENAKRGKSLDECYPFKATVDQADLLESKLNSLEQIILPNMDDLKFDDKFKN